MNRITLGVLLAAASLPTTAAGQPAPSAVPATAANPAQTSAAIAALRPLLRDRYVLPETAAALDKAVGDAERRGEFKGLAGEALAAKVNAVMEKVTPDGHLGMSYNPARARVLAEAPPPSADGGGLPQGYARDIVRSNAGVAKLEVLPGNIRYLDYTGFAWGTPEAERAMAGAAEFLRGGDAVIVDLRRNGGGSAEAVAALASYFLPADTPLMTFQTRGEAAESSVSRAVPFTLADRPVYVLTSKNSFSAAEEFAAHVSAFGFGTLVGETTGGGGFNNSFFPLPGGYVVSISTGQATQAKTGMGWERVGIAPAIAVPADRALDRAKAEAMARLAAEGPEDERAAAGKMAVYYRALADGFAATRPLADYAGTYGERTIALDAKGGLTTQRAGGRVVPLVAIGPDLFVPEGNPSQHFRFVPDAGAIAALEVDTSAGPQRAPRTT